MLEGIDVNKADGLCQCNICYYKSFPNINFRFQLNVCESCHDLIQKAVCFNDVAIAFVKGNDYTIHILHMSK